MKIGLVTSTPPPLVCTGLSLSSSTTAVSLPDPLLFVAHNLHVIRRHVIGFNLCQSFQLTLKGIINGKIRVAWGVQGFLLYDTVSQSLRAVPQYQVSFVVGASNQQLPLNCIRQMYFSLSNSTFQRLMFSQLCYEESQSLPGCDTLS